MRKKPTYEELKRRVKELEKEALERKQAVDALRESEERYRLVFEPSLIDIALVSHDGKVNLE